MMVSTQFPPKIKIPPKKGFNIPFTKKVIKKKIGIYPLKKSQGGRRGGFKVYSLKSGKVFTPKRWCKILSIHTKTCEHGNPSSFLERIFTDLKYLPNTFKKFLQMFYM
jgi:hypothetical protein